MKKITTSIFAFLLTMSYLTACQVEVILDVSGTFYTAEVSGVEAYELIWPDGTVSDTYPVQSDEPVVCVNLIANDGDCNVTACYSDINPNECSAEIYLNDAGEVCVLATGEAPFEYFWDCGATEQCITYMGPMDYCLTVVDAQGCVVEVCQFIEADCYVQIVPQLDGTLLLAQPGGVAPYTYLWSDGHECPAIVVADVGLEYCVTITDAEGCTASACYGGTSFCAVEIFQEPIAPNLITAEAQGVPPLEYLWNTGETLPTILIEPGAEYCVTVIDATGCTEQDCFFWNSGCSVDIDILPSPGWGYQLISHAQGTGPFNYEWSTGESTPEIFVTDWGYYCLIITDANGCVSEACVIVEDECSVSIFETSASGAIELNAFALGQAPFGYLWNNGESGPVILVETFGEYCVEVVDANGCISSSCYWVSNDDCGVQIVEVEMGNGAFALFADAYGATDLEYTWSDGTTGAHLFDPVPGSNYCVTILDGFGCYADDCLYTPECAVEIVAEILADGQHILHAIAEGSPPYNFEWSNGEVGESIIVDGGGEYCVWMGDGIDCWATNCIWLGTDPCSVSIVNSSGDAVQYLTADAFGLGPFTYEWSTGEVSQTIEVVLPGTYCVNVVDQTGCLAFGCYEVIDTVGGCVVFIWEESTPNGETLLNALPITNDVFTYNWSTGANTQSIEVTDPGEYCVTIQNEGGTTCSTCYQYDFAVLGNDITGLIHLPSNSAGAYMNVELFMLIDGGAAELIAQDTVTIVPGFDGQYFFPNAPDGEFVVRATEIEGIVPSNYAPTYHFMSLTSEEAQVIINPHNQSTLYSILMIELDEGGDGPGVIGGTITDSEGRSFVPDGGISVFLTDLNETPIEYLRTEMDGQFSIGNIAFGDYYLIVDIPGLPMAKERISITEDHIIHDISVEVNPSGIVLGTPHLVQLEARIYPNPAQDYVQLEGLEKLDGPVNLRIFNVDGRLAQSVNALDTRTQIWIGDLAEGLYLFRIEGEGFVQTIKIVKKN